MLDIPFLLADFTPLVDTVDLQNLTISCEYCQRYGWFYSAHAFRGTASVLLLHNLPSPTDAEFREALDAALLDQLAAWYLNAARL